MTRLPQRSEERAQCSVMVHEGFHSWQCSLKAKVERGGRWYCGTHDPERVAARDAKRKARRAYEDRVRSAEWRVKDAERDVLRVVREARADAVLLESAAQRLLDADYALEAARQSVTGTPS